jgi:hypothetical protein
MIGVASKGEVDFPLLLGLPPHRTSPPPAVPTVVLRTSTMPLTLPLDVSGKDASVRRALLNLSLAVAKSKRIVVVTGAGISCSCGIPVR